LPDVPPPLEGATVSTTDTGGGATAFYLVVPVTVTGIPNPASNPVGAFSFAVNPGVQ
jgi:hypothetical protein